MEKKLYLSTEDKKLLGVCGGIAEYFNIDSTLVRLGFVVLLFATFSTWSLIYLIMGIVIPKDPNEF